MSSIDKRPDGTCRARWREPGGRQRAKHFERKRDAETFLASVVHNTAAWMPERTGLPSMRIGGPRRRTGSTRPASRSAHTCAGRCPISASSASTRSTSLSFWVFASRSPTSTRHQRQRSRCTTPAPSCGRPTGPAASPVINLGRRAPKRRGGDVDGVVGADQVPTRDEVVAIIAAAPDRHRAAIVLGACGLRIGEVAGVTDDRLDLEVGTLRVDRQLQRHGDVIVFTAPRREKKRTVALPSWAGSSCGVPCVTTDRFDLWARATSEGCCSGGVVTLRSVVRPSTTQHGDRR